MSILKPADLTHRNDPAQLRWFNIYSGRSILPEPKMTLPAAGVVRVCSQRSCSGTAVGPPMPSRVARCILAGISTSIGTGSRTSLRFPSSGSS